MNAGVPVSEPAFAPPLSGRSPGRVVPPGLRRQAVVAGVVLLHGLGLWALQSGLLGRAVERFTFVPVLAQLIEAPPAPDIPPAPHQVEPTPQPKHRSAAPLRPQPGQQPAPIADVLLAPPAAPAVVPVSPEPVVGAPTAPPEPVAPPAPAQIVLPSSSAAYLHNAPPPYPAVSRQLGEAGRVVVRVFIELDGTARQAQVVVSSGYERLDQVALRTARQWRYVPGQQGGVPQAMWFDVPIHFVLG